jgi:membrane protease YdiL (CAAX protease family)
MGALIIYNPDNYPSDWLDALVLPVVVLAAYWLFVRYAEHRRVYELAGGLAGLEQFGLGALLALVQPVLVVVVWYTLGVARTGGFNDWHMFSLTLGAFVLAGTAAVFEELLFRGLILRYVELKLGSWPAILISGGLFSIWHIGNPGFTLWNYLDLAVVGVALGAAYVLTRRLWLGIAMHAFHNLALSILLSSDTTIPLIRWVAAGNPYWVSQIGAFYLWLIGIVIVATLLVSLVLLKGAAVGPQGAWLRQLGMSSGGQFATTVMAAPLSNAEESYPPPAPTLPSATETPAPPRVSATPLSEPEQSS